jgi:hypothetical protein
MPAILLQSLLGFEPHDGRWITGVLVGVDDPRRLAAPDGSLRPKPWRESARPLLRGVSRQQEIDRRTKP